MLLAGIHKRRFKFCSTAQVHMVHSAAMHHLLELLLPPLPLLLPPGAEWADW